MGGTNYNYIYSSIAPINLCILDVDRGDTVLDYLKMERERGITITSAAVTFKYAQGKKTEFVLIFIIVDGKIIRLTWLIHLATSILPSKLKDPFVFLTAQ